LDGQGKNQGTNNEGKAGHGVKASLPEHDVKAAAGNVPVVPNLHFGKNMPNQALLCINFDLFLYDHECAT
jgi:hypothetical protein